MGEDYYTTNPSKVVQEIRDKLEKLYSSTGKFQRAAVDALFSSMLFPEMPPGRWETMDSPIELAEVTQTIKTLKANKRLGPNGFPESYYKKFSDSLKNGSFSPRPYKHTLLCSQKPR